MGIEWSTADLILASVLAIVFCIVIYLIRSRTGHAEKILQMAEPVVAPAFVPAPGVAIEAGIDEETVAAIMAAVYFCFGESDTGVRYAVKNIARAQGERPVWGFAGMQLNTRPF